MDEEDDALPTSRKSTDSHSGKRSDEPPCFPTLSSEETTRLSTDSAKRYSGNSDTTRYSIVSANNNSGNFDAEGLNVEIADNKLVGELSRTNSKSWADVATTLVDDVITLTSICNDELKEREQENLKKTKMTVDQFPSYYTLSVWTYQELLPLLHLDDDVTLSRDVKDVRNDTSAATEAQETINIRDDGVIVDSGKETLETASTTLPPEPGPEVVVDPEAFTLNDYYVLFNQWLSKLMISLSRMLVLFLSFTSVGHLLTQSGRCAYSVIFWKAYIMIKVSLGIWDNDCMQAFDADKNFAEMLISDSDERNMGIHLEAIIGTRSALFQLIPGLTLLSVYVQSTSKAPIYVTSEKLLKCVPSFLFTFPQARELAIEVELRSIGEHHNQIDNYEEYNIQVRFSLFIYTLTLFTIIPRSG